MKKIDSNKVVELRTLSHESCTVNLRINNTHKTITVFNLLSLTPRQGHATKLTERVCAIADKLDYVIFLNPKPYFYTRDNITQEGLINFYSKFGFKKLGYGKPITMIRKPNSQEKHTL